MAASKEVQEFRNATHPGETEASALLRKIKMHEFLMTGGVMLGYEKGVMRYGPPITVATDPVCPFHGEDCPAWEEIVAGRGHWTRMETELWEAEAELENLVRGYGEHDEELADRISALRDSLEFRPRDAKTLRERTPEQLDAERREAKMAKAAQKLATKASQPKTGVYAKAGKKTGGNPWDRGPSDSKPMIFEPEDDARNDAVAAFAGEELPDVIEIDGDEGEEGDE